MITRWIARGLNHGVDQLLAMAGDQNDALLLNDRTERQASLRNFGLMGSYPCLNDGMPCLLFLQ